MSRYILKISGKRLDTFVMMLIKLKIAFKKVKQAKDYLIIEVLEEDYLDILKIKTTYKIEILKRKGLAAVIHFFKIRKLFIGACLLGFFFLQLLTNIIFEIRVVDTDKEIRELIIDDLKKFGIREYGFKVSYKKKEEIEQKILKLENATIEWLEIEEIGTSYEVKLIKRVKNDITEETEPRNIVARKKGLITRIVADEGEVVAKKNAYVKKYLSKISFNITPTILI